MTLSIAMKVAGVVIDDTVTPEGEDGRPPVAQQQQQQQDPGAAERRRQQQMQQLSL